jgi:hypothetical protein
LTEVTLKDTHAKQKKAMMMGAACISHVRLPHMAELLQHTDKTCIALLTT